MALQPFNWQTIRCAQPTCSKRRQVEEEEQRAQRFMAAGVKPRTFETLSITCSGCKQVYYCSSACKRQHYSSHALVCLGIETLLTADTVHVRLKNVWSRVSDNNRRGEYRDSAELLYNTVSFIDFHLGFGKEQPDLGTTPMWRTAYVTWRAKYELGVSLYNLKSDDALSASESTLMSAIRVLEPWMDSKQQEGTGDRNDASEDKCNRGELQHAIVDSEQAIARVLMQKRDLDFAVTHISRAVEVAEMLYKEPSAGIIEREDRLYKLFHVLSSAAQIFVRKKEFPSAVLYYTRAYTAVSDFYGPAHPLIQEVVETLAETCMLCEDYEQAARWARLNYDILTDKRYGLDSEGPLMAATALQLSEICWRSVRSTSDKNSSNSNGVSGPGTGTGTGTGSLFVLDPSEGEVFARKAADVFVRLNGNGKLAVVPYLRSLREVLQVKGDFGEEPKRLLERALVILSKKVAKNDPAAVDPCIATLEALSMFHQRRADSYSAYDDDSYSVGRRAEEIKASKMYFEQAICSRAKFNKRFGGQFK
jgi:tetratricopeptide (TPR) repeat protein